MPGHIDTADCAPQQRTVTRRSFLGLFGVAAGGMAGASLLSSCGLDFTGDPERSDARELRWVLGQAVPTLDVAKSAGGPIPLLALSHETLVRLDQDLGIVPVLAESWSEPTPTEIVYTLRSGATFWDGSPVTADDIAFSVNRHLDPSVGSPIASLLGNFKEVTVTADDELTIFLARPDPTAKYLPALCHVTPRSHTEALGDAFGVSGADITTVGSGPYQITKFDASVGIEYEVNSTYWGGEARYQKITIDFVPDANARQLSLRGNAAQGTMDVPVAAFNEWQKIPHITLQSSPPLVSVFLTLNVNREPFDDVRVRRALAHAVDREGFVQALVHGQGEPANAVAPKAHWTNLTDEGTVHEIYDSLPAYDFDLDKARAELASSKHPEGFSVTVRFPDANPHLGRALVSMSEALRPLNIILNVEEAPMADWRSEVMSHEHDMNIMMLRPNYPDPTDFLNLVLPGSAAEVGQYNIAEYRSDVVDELLDRQSRAKGEERITLLAEILDKVADDLPYVPLWWESSSMAASNDLDYVGYSTLYYYQLWSDNVHPVAG